MNSLKITRIQTKKLKYFYGWEIQNLRFSCAEWQLAEKDFDNFQ